MEVGYSRIDVLDDEISKLSKSLSRSKIRQRLRKSRTLGSVETKNMDSISKYKNPFKKTSMEIAMQVKQQAVIQSLQTNISEMKKNLKETKQKVRDLEFRLGDSPVTISNMPDIIEASTSRHYKNIQQLF